MLRRLLCLFGRHERSAGRVREDADGIFRSNCRTCGCELERDDATRRWDTRRKTAGVRKARARAQAARSERRNGERRQSDRGARDRRTSSDG